MTEVVKPIPENNFQTTKCYQKLKYHLLNQGIDLIA